LYTVWNTDSSGNFISDNIGTVSGSSYALESLESSFHQDLNGDGVIGPTTVIEAFGSTSLVEVANNFYLNSNSSGSGPALKLNGADVVAGQFGSVAPIGAEQTTSGYEVAWKATGADAYTVWNTDGNGNFISDTIGTVSGSSYALESLESSFHQDLNGDGVIGIPTPSSGGTLTISDVQNDNALISLAGNHIGSTVLVSVTAGGLGSDTFVFHPGVGANVIANLGSADKIELDGFSSVTDSNQLTMLLNEAQTGQQQSMFQSTNDGHDTVINLGNHDSITLANVHVADLHASNFIIH
jgi:20S proteasome alpha/beta subunit